MIDFDKPSRVKTEDEKRFDDLNAEYQKAFGIPYVFDYAAESMTFEETLADMRRRIAENDPQKPPAYKPGVEY